MAGQQPAVEQAVTADHVRDRERERDVPGLVADRVGVDLADAEPAQETIREVGAQQRERAGVMGRQDRVSAGLLGDRGQAPAISASASSQDTAVNRPLPFGPSRRSGVSSLARGSSRAPL